jgi:hypothetical protein
MLEPITIDFKSETGSHILVFEDNGKVAYAYLEKDGAAVGDVWLYNRCPTPDVPEWKDKSNIPFANPKAYVSEEGQMTRDVGLEDVLVTWKEDKRGPVALVYVFQHLYGFLGVGDRPGYARHAIKNGPLAKVIEFEDAK